MNVVIAAAGRVIPPGAIVSVALIALIALSATIAPITSTALAQVPDHIELGADQLRRLGIEWATPESVAGRTVAAAPAVAVVPPAAETVVSAPVGGLITRVFVAESSEVTAGTPLLELRSLELLAAQREYIDAVAAARIADAQLERDRTMHDEGIIANRRLDETRAEALGARLRTEQARQHLHLAGVDDAALERMASRGEISPEVTLHAPTAGIVIERRGAVGEQVEALDPLVRIANLERLWLEMRVPQERMRGLSTGMTLEASIHAQALTGEIIAIGRSVDAGTQTVLVRAEVENPDGLIRAGQVLQARVLADAGAGDLLGVPSAAIVRIGTDAFVFASDPRGVRLARVSVVGDDGGRARIATRDLGPADRVATRGVSALKALITADDE